MLLGSLVVGLLYWGILRLYYQGWERCEPFVSDVNYKKKVAVVIPARDEAENIGACLKSILQNEYPSEALEIIVINDHSSDDTAQIAGAFPQVRVLDLEKFSAEFPKEGGFKKFGIEKAIQHCEAEIILQTDADCIVQKNWIQTAVNFLETTGNVAFTGIVHFDNGNTLQRFQALDLAGMMQVTAAGYTWQIAEMGNGANMGFYKQAFVDVDGFEGVRTYASGDDVFLLQKLNDRWPEKVGYLKNNNQAVSTAAPATWRAFWRQRLRWATKNGSYKKNWIPIILAYIFFYCNVLLFALVFAPVFPVLLPIFLTLFLMKTLGDYLFLRNACRYFSKMELLQGYLLSQVFHTFYIFWVGWKSIFVKEYQWKNRTVR